MACHNCTITRYFATAISEQDINKFGMVIGEARGQQLWDALAILIAIDLWTKEWHRERIVLKVRSDNVAALTLLTKMRPPPAKDDNGDRVPAQQWPSSPVNWLCDWSTCPSHPMQSTRQDLGTSWRIDYPESTHHREKDASRPPSTRPWHPHPRPEHPTAIAAGTSREPPSRRRPCAIIWLDGTYRNRHLSGAVG